MPQVETSVDRYDGLTFVRATVTNHRNTPQRVRLRSRLDGPTWVPHGETVSAPEWTDGCWEARIEPGRTVGVGFVTPAAPEEPLLEVVSDDRASRDDDSRAEDVLAELEGARPPSEVLSRDP